MLTWEDTDSKFLQDQRDFLRQEIVRRTNSSSYHDQFMREVYQCALKELEEKMGTDKGV